MPFGCPTRMRYSAYDGDSATFLVRSAAISVHGRFTAESVADVRSRIPGVNVLVHPECQHEVVLAADYIGSTEYIIKTIEAARIRFTTHDGMLTIESIEPPVSELVRR